MRRGSARGASPCSPRRQGYSASRSTRPSATPSSQPRSRRERRAKSPQLHAGREKDHYLRVPQPHRLGGSEASPGLYHRRPSMDPALRDARSRSRARKLDPTVSCVPKPARMRPWLEKSTSKEADGAWSTALSNLLDDELEGSCGALLDEIYALNKPQSQPSSSGTGTKQQRGLGRSNKRPSLQELAVQIAGLADVRHFVDEQLASDLRERLGACKRLLAAMSPCGVVAAHRGVVAATPGSAYPSSVQLPALRSLPDTKMALAPFRSRSRNGPVRITA